MVSMTQGSTTTSERRGSQRFSLNAPLVLITEGREIPAYTRDLSNRGVYFFVALPDSAQIGPELEFTVELPAEITLSTCCRIQCRGRILRREEASINLTGMAAEILEYSIQRGAETG